jgi:hypothetical protein
MSRYEGVTVESAPVSELQDLVGDLHQPWIADEGPTDCGFRRGLDGQLRMRGLAFDSKTTVVWDEDEVQVIRPANHQPGVIPLTSDVLVRDRDGWPEKLVRTDYLRHGALIASRYTCAEQAEGRSDAQS